MAASSILLLQSKPAKTMSYTNYFADALTAEAANDSRIIAVHAAMAGGTGLTRWAQVCVLAPGCSCLLFGGWLQLQT